MERCRRYGKRIENNRYVPIGSNTCTARWTSLNLNSLSLFKGSKGLYSNQSWELIARVRIFLFYMIDSVNTVRFPVELYLLKQLHDNNSFLNTRYCDSFCYGLYCMASLILFSRLDCAGAAGGRCWIVARSFVARSITRLLLLASTNSRLGNGNGERVLL